MKVSVDPFDIKRLWRPFRTDSMRFQEVFSHHDDYSRLVKETDTLAYLIRSYSVYSMTCAALGHPGGSFSEAELLADKLAAFNLQPWAVRNGHNVAEIVDLFNTLHTQRRGKPSAVILNTIMGKGIGACQHNPNWHTSAPRNKETAQTWLMELWQRSGRRRGVPEEFPISPGEAITIVPPLHDNPDEIIEKQA